MITEDIIIIEAIDYYSFVQELVYVMGMLFPLSCSSTYHSCDVDRDLVYIASIIIYLCQTFLTLAYFNTIQKSVLR